MMKNTLTKLSLGVLMATGLSVSPVVMAEESPISANVALTSNYIYRGFEQFTGTSGTEHTRAAIQGGFDYSHDSGFYAGLWASSAGWATGEETYADNYATIEKDYYFGFGKELESGVSYDIGYLYYDYAGESLDLSEVYVKLGYEGFGFQYSVGMEAPDAGSTIPDYAAVSYETEIKGFGLGVTYASNIDISTYGQVDVSYSYAGLDFGMSLVSNKNDGASKADDLKTAFSVSKSF